MTENDQAGHRHHCPDCGTDWECRCWGGAQSSGANERLCLRCLQESSLPRVVKNASGWRESKLGGIVVSRGGWSNRWVSTRELRAALKRWVKQSLECAPEDAEHPEYGPSQCGGCRYFAAWDGDYGLCCNPRSPQDGRFCFEHGGCPQHSTLEEIEHDNKA